MSHRNSQKSQKFSLRFLSAARAEGTFRDFRDFCVTINILTMVLHIGVRFRRKVAANSEKGSTFLSERWHLSWASSSLFSSFLFLMGAGGDSRNT